VHTVFKLDQTRVIEDFGLVEPEALLDFSLFNAQQVKMQLITEVTDVIFDKQVSDAYVLKDLAGPGNDTRRFRNETEIYLRRSIRSATLEKTIEK
jgi:hypothetical protein